MHSHHDVRKRHAGDDGHAVALDQLIHNLYRDFRLELAVLFEHLDRHAAELAAVGLNHHHESIELILTERALRS